MEPMIAIARKYSDVVRFGSRSLSPAPRGAAVDPPDLRIDSSEYPGDDEIPEALKAAAGRAVLPARAVEFGLPKGIQKNLSPSSPISETEVEQDDLQSWTKVVRRRSRDTRTHGKLMPEQAQAIRKAEKRLASDERIRKRSENDSAQENSLHERESVPKERMGKGNDPRNCGASSVSSDELGVDAQRTALVRNTAHRLARESDDNLAGPLRAAKRVERPPKKDKSRRERKMIRKAFKSPDAPPNPVEDMVDKTVRRAHKRRERQRTLRAMEPVKQIDPKSYIGLAFKRLEWDEKRSRRREKSSESEESDSSSDSSDSSSSSDDDTDALSSANSSNPPSDGDDSSSTTTYTSSGSSESSRRRRHHRRERSYRHRSHDRRSRKSKKRSKSHRKTILEPIPPTKYDGSDDLYAFHRFMTEDIAYVEDGHVAPKKRALILSHYLTKRGLEFYMREVSGNPYKWRLLDFFAELFNYCFPSNLRLWQEEKLRSCYQNSKTVKNYLRELDGLWGMVGGMDERAKVHKLWSGFRTELQCDLRREKLDPKVSSLKTIAATSEILEIAQSVTNENARSTRRPHGETRTAGSTATSTTEPGSSNQWRKRNRRRRDRQAGHPNGATPSVSDQYQKKEAHNNKRKHDAIKLGKEEQERRKAESQCYNYRKLGHFSRSCPDRHTVTGIVHRASRSH
ncbi:hypothetical protein F5141DRAFT_256491 [Pisolithus sp. B1]|nr:hypothetical protein F5141DRAFT_256491 [Pisolithus sp. B1]